MCWRYYKTVSCYSDSFLELEGFDACAHARVQNQTGNVGRACHSTCIETKKRETTYHNVFTYNTYRQQKLPSLNDLLLCATPSPRPPSGPCLWQKKMVQKMASYKQMPLAINKWMNKMMPTRHILKVLLLNWSCTLPLNT